MRTKMIAFTIAIGSMLLTGTSFANPTVTDVTGTGPRYIQEIGCHLTDKTCFVTISGGAVGASPCVSNSIRWREDAPNGQSILALLTSAFSDQKRVNFAVFNDSCFTPQPQYPTFWYIIIPAN